MDYPASQRSTLRYSSKQFRLMPELATNGTYVVTESDVFSRVVVGVDKLVFRSKDKLVRW